jgi:hypothetical protein
MNFPFISLFCNLFFLLFFKKTRSTTFKYILSSIILIVIVVISFRLADANIYNPWYLPSILFDFIGVVFIIIPLVKGLRSKKENRKSK